MSKFRAFKNKFAVCKRNEDGSAEVAVFEKDKRGNTVPKFYDSKSEAAIGIAHEVIRIAEEEKEKGVEAVGPPNSFEVLDTYFIASAELITRGELFIFLDQEFGNYEEIYKGHIVNLIT